jgi:mannose-6-phosphate isomerase-like protein (cupin superfamily)
MAKSGQVIENPATGERAKWHLTTSDTDGERLRLELWVRPGGGVPERHLHASSEERFEVIAGTMALRRGEDRLELTRGNRATVPAGVPHCWWNPASDEELHFMVEVVPALRFEPLLETAFGVERDAHARGKRGMGLLQLAVLMREFGSETRPASPPYWIQRTLFAVLAPIGRALGRRPVYEAYSGSLATEVTR